MAMAQLGGSVAPEGVGRGRTPGVTVRRVTPLARVAGAALIAIMLCGGFVGQRVYLMNLTYRLEAEQARVRQLAQENEFLRLQVARARSLDRIEAVARGRLGMVPADRKDVVVVPERRDPVRGGIAMASTRETGTGGERGWLAALLHWANERWPGRAAEAGSPPSP